MDEVFSQLQLLKELDARHDELIERLDDLEKRVAEALAEFVPSRHQGGNCPDPTDRTVLGEPLGACPHYRSEN